MNNFQNRLSTVSSMYSTASMFFLFFCALSHLYYIQFEKPTLKTLKPAKIALTKGRIPNDWKNKPTLGRLHFDIDADLRNYFNWNTKMLFVSVICEFSNDQYHLNHAVVWDDVIWNKEDALIKYKKKRGEYPIHDLTDKLQGTTANLTLQFQIIPWVGFMVTDRVTVENAVTFIKTV
ncbi:Signal peptidase complex subunit [Boothiomyces macroporosus]|uniref:Signal peptidase subunit 3 n=1 Tax=Boothiomyces macroporosus TaxID=261099 RepID=A0AAD5Y4W9_9FUNG|nr:Signal peptidase complex subunit [Boothiomyces macroporosus]